ncbi:MAG: imidazole glycerol phosphate synthase subunit HisF [Gemmatimonadetes bacterium]|nr:imidazole glycerol phosphate synthase subunit HisF [Gemmatimonadota bacterium]
MSWPRIIVCLDVAKGRVVKGTQFKDLKDQGDLVDLALRYADQGADEIAFLDIEASAEAAQERSTRLDWVERVARHLFVPFSVGGGVRSWSDALRLLDSGADRISVGSAAVARPEVLGEIASRAGAQAVILSLDARHSGPDRCIVTRRGGREDTTIDALDFARTAVAHDAGEILLNVIDSDGTRAGFDIPYTRTIAEGVSVPVIASGGAGRVEDFLAVLKEGKAAAALGAGVFHDGTLTVGNVKTFLTKHGVPVRPC